MNDYYQKILLYIEHQDAFLAGVYLIFGKVIGAVLFLPGAPLTLLSGVLLGTFWGTIVAIIGNTIGAMLAFLLARYFLQNYVQNTLLKKYPKIDEYENHISRHGFKTVVFLRLIPLFPFNALNFILGVTQVRFKDYFWGTLIGIIPGTFAFVHFGESFRMLSPVNIGLAVLGIIGLSYIGKFWKLKEGNSTSHGSNRVL